MDNWDHSRVNSRNNKSCRQFGDLEVTAEILCYLNCRWTLGTGLIKPSTHRWAWKKLSRIGEASISTYYSPKHVRGCNRPSVRVPACVFVCALACARAMYDSVCVCVWTCMHFFFSTCVCYWGPLIHIGVCYKCYSFPFSFYKHWKIYPKMHFRKNSLRQRAWDLSMY